MPTYEFQCENCERLTEVFQAIGDAHPKKCEHCGGKLTKIFHPVGIQFKGSGFHATDYAKPGAKPGEKSGESDRKSVV